MNENACLSPAFPEKLVILSCKTNGGKATYHRVIELAIIWLDQREVVERWHTLINPKMYVPLEVQNVTGISPAELKQADSFKRIAKSLWERLQGYTLVAHNARFHYGFLKNEFKRAGLVYSNKPLCALKLSRLLFTQYKRHSLTEIIRRFDLPVENQHRATDETQVVWRLLLSMSELCEAESIQQACTQILKQSSLPAWLDKSQISRLPNTPGVYYFYNQRGHLLYVGKSVRIRERVMSHFTQDYNNAKDLEMSALIAHIEFDATPSDFGAQLLESQQIKALKPRYNRRLTKVSRLYQYQLAKNEHGYLIVRIVALDSQRLPEEYDPRAYFGLFRSQSQAEAQLVKQAEYFFLCHKLCRLQGADSTQSHKPCFNYQLKRCLGACCQQEAAEAYNERVYLALNDYRHKAWPWKNAILVEEVGVMGDGQGEAKLVWHLINEWCYLGRIHHPDELYAKGFVLAEADSIARLPDLQPVMTSYFDLDVYLILVRFLLQPEQIEQHGLRIRELVSA